MSTFPSTKLQIKPSFWSTVVSIAQDAILKEKYGVQWKIWCEMKNMVWNAKYGVKKNNTATILTSDAWNE